jgi:hypothetical protein
MPASLYAATKRSCELLAGVYHNIYNVSTTGLRFFTVYGPWGRPDMAALAFAHKITQGHPVKIFKGPDGQELARDFTYIDDIVRVCFLSPLCTFQLVRVLSAAWNLYALKPVSLQCLCACHSEYAFTLACTEKVSSFRLLFSS